MVSRVLLIGGGAWRILVIASLFILFALSALFFTTIIVPLLHLLISSPERRVTITRRFVRLTFSIVFNIATFTRVCRLTVTSKASRAINDLRRGLIIANHPTFLDVIALLSVVPGATCVAKHHLLKNPSIGPMVRSAGYVTNESPEALLEHGIAAIESGSPLIIFPEGTRSTGSGLQPFHRGAATLASRTRCDILALLITCDPPAFLKGSPWYKLPSSPFHLKIDLLDLLEFGSGIYDSCTLHEEGEGIRRARREKEMTRALENLYYGRLPKNHERREGEEI